MQVNHLSPMLLTLELLPILLDSASSSGDGRIVFLSSRAHSGGSWNPATMNPQSEAQYERMKTYGNTKMYNVRPWVLTNNNNNTGNIFACNEV